MIDNYNQDLRGFSIFIMFIVFIADDLLGGNCIM